MAIHISLESTEIPVQIGDFSYIVNIDDDSLIEMQQSMDELKEEIQQIESDDLDSARDILSKTCDCILGDGAFGDLYEKCPSTSILSKVLIELWESLDRELRNRNNKQNVQSDNRPGKRNRSKRKDL